MQGEMAEEDVEIVVRLVESESELMEIISLESLNLRRNLGEDNLASGYVTAEYDLDFLKEMHESTPSVIAVSASGRVVGYTLACNKQIGAKHTQNIAGFVSHAEQLEHNGKAMRDVNYLIGGQLCVAEGYRNRGLAAKMYNHMRDVYSKRGFTCCMTDVAGDNPRSLRAHIKAGFQSINTFTDHDTGVCWHIIICEW